MSGSIDDEQDTVTLEEEIRAHGEHREFVRNAPPREVRLVEYALAPLCNVNSQFLAPGIEGECSPSNGTVTRPGCGDDDPVMPLWRSARTSASAAWTRWAMIVGWICPDDLIPRLTEKDFRKLKIESPEAHRQPATGDVLVNKPLIVYTERVDRSLRTSLFGAGIDVVATPVEHTWTFGDGGTLTTTSPGAPYPSFELTHQYTHHDRDSDADDDLVGQVPGRRGPGSQVA